MSEKQPRRLSERNAEVPRRQPEQLRGLGLGTEAPLEPHPDTSAFPSGTSNAAALGGSHHDTAEDAARSVGNVPVRGKNPLVLGR